MYIFVPVYMYVIMITRNTCWHASRQLTMAKVEVTIPRKQGAAAMGRDKALARFHDAIMRAVIQVLCLVSCLQNVLRVQID